MEEREPSNLPETENGLEPEAPPVPPEANTSTGEGPLSPTTSATKVDSFFEALPRSLNTRRRYSEFRPVPLPTGAWEETVTEEEGDPSLHEEDLIERVSVFGRFGEGAPQLKGASDLDLFLQNQRDKDNIKDQPTEQQLPKQQTKGYNLGQLALVILLGLLTACQILTFICLFSFGGLEDDFQHNFTYVPRPDNASSTLRVQLRKLANYD